LKYSAIILAAGSGKRTGLKLNKVLYKINEKSVIEYSLDFFKKDINCVDILLVVSDIDYKYCLGNFIDEKIKIILGGSTRRDSVRLALSSAVSDFVLVHDGARPFIKNDFVEKILISLKNNDSVTLGVKVKDTIQEVDGNCVVKTLDRNKLIITQTPQGFNRDLLIKAHDIALEKGYYGTDDTMLLEKFLGINAVFVLGDYRNIKLTTEEDIKLLEVILK
jgi:2-C-methyl-D-erythritol 4-phosphate cytidylyltransferase